MADTHFSGPLIVGGEQISPTATVHNDAGFKERTLRVASDGDFKTLHSALRWLESSPPVLGETILMLEDGVHYLFDPNEPDASSSHAYRFENKGMLVLKSESGDSSLVTLTPNPSMPDAYIWGFRILGGTDFAIIDITIDGTAGGGPIAGDKLLLLVAQQGGSVRMGGCEIRNTYNVIDAYGSGGAAYMSNCVVDNVSGVAYNADLGGSIFCKDGSVSNSGGAFAMGLQSGVGTIVASGVTLTSNTTDYSIPVNEIQYNGSYISNDTGPLSFKA